MTTRDASFCRGAAMSCACVYLCVLQVPERGDADVQIVLRLRVPDSHSDCPLGEKYGAAEEACSELVRARSCWLAAEQRTDPETPRVASFPRFTESGSDTPTTQTAMT